MIKVLLSLILLLMVFMPGTMPLANTAYHEPVADSAGESVKAKALEIYGELPLLFIENKGQLDAEVRYYVQADGQTVYLTDDGMVFDLIRYRNDVADMPDPADRQAERLVFSINFVGASESSTVQGRDRGKAAVNYFIGSDPEKWYSDITSYKEVVYQNVYPGIDLRLYDNAGLLEYDFIVAPGANVSDIALAYSGIDRLTLQGGQLVAQTPLGEIKQSQPYIYQRVGEREVAVDGAFTLANNNTYGFEVAAYNASYPIIIDPSLLYSTYLGGIGSYNYNDFGIAVAADSSGCAYVTGATYSTAFPVRNAYQATGGGTMRYAFVTKIDTTKSGDASLVYSTYLGGSDHDGGVGIVVDASGCAYISGSTSSTDFPTTLNPYQAANAGICDAFITKLNASGNGLVYSTYLGGSARDIGSGIAVDSSGCAYIAGITVSTDFPTLNPYRAANAGVCDAFISKFNASGSALIYSTYLGGSATDSAVGIALDSNQCAYIAGVTASTDFPILNPYQTANAGGCDAFITKLNASGNALVYSTYLGGSGYDGYIGSSRSIHGGIAVDPAGCAYIAGLTTSFDFPTHNAYDGTLDGPRDAFITRLSASGTALDYSTYLGGSGEDYVVDTAVDSSGYAYVTGVTKSTDFPTHSPLQAWDTYSEASMFVSKVDTTASGTSSLMFSTYLGGNMYDGGYGIAVDPSGYAYVTGSTNSVDFPTENGYQPTPPPSALNQIDAFVAKIDTSIVNNPPYIPSSLSPQHRATAVSSNVTLSWAGGDPDAGDNVTYNIYLGSSPPWLGWPLVSQDQVETTYDPPVALTENAFYYWRVVAKDSHGAQAFGPNCLFFTTSIPPQVTTEDVTNIEAESTSENATFRARLNGNLTSLGSGSSAVVSFLWCIDPSVGVGTHTYVTGYQTLYTTGPFSADLTGLQAGTRYCYLALAMPTFNLNNAALGVTKTFTTGVATVTGTGAATFLSDSGAVTEAAAVAEATLPTTGKPDVTFPHGLFSFTISDIPVGSSVTVTLNLPSEVPQGTEYWKYDAVQGWVEVTSLMGDDDGDNVLTLTLTDGGPGDGDGIANGVIVDPGGPGVPAVVPESPTVTAVNPPTGTQGETLDVTITGTHFSGVTSVKFGEFGSYVTANNFTEDSDTQITANVTILSYASPGTRNVTVTTPGGTASLDDGFTVSRAGEQTQSVNTATNTGTTTFTTDGGSINNLTASATTPCGSLAGFSFPHGFFSFSVTNITPGSTATITITLPYSLPAGAQYWKCQNGQWVNATSLLGSNDGDNVLTITLTDGGSGDADGAANGTIVDPGGPAIPAPAPPVPSARRVSPSVPSPSQLPSADIRLHNISVSPGQSQAGQPVTVLANVVNNGASSGSYNVALRINGRVEQQRTIEVSPGTAYPVKFTVTKSQPGTYDVAIEGQKVNFTVLGGSASGAPASGGLIIIIVMAVLILATAVVLMISFRRPA